MRAPLTLAFVALLGLGGCQPSDDLAPSAATWLELRPEGGHFSVLMPGTPSQRTESRPTPWGQVESVIFELRREGDPIAYAIRYTELAPLVISVLQGVSNLLQATQIGIARVNEATLLGEAEKITLDGHPGRHFELQLPDGTIQSYRIFYVAPRMYQLSVHALADGVSPEAVSRFLESFSPI